jgi:hypothetical protein
MPELIKQKCRNPDAHLDEQDLKDIAEAKEDILQGRVYTTKELRAKLGDSMKYSFLRADRFRKDF